MTDLPTTFSPHPAQWKILESKKRFILATAGIQAGKTTIGAIWTLRKIQENNFEGTFLIAAPTYKILAQSTIPKFFEICGGAKKLGHYRKNDSEIDLHGGKGRIYIRSCEEPDYLEGMTITDGAWLDEAGQMSEKVYTNVLGRVSIKQAPILMTTTPYKLNWVYREIVKRWQRGEPDYEVVMWKSIDNPVFPKEEYEARKKSMSEADFARRYGGEWREIAGLVYPDFSYEKCVITPQPYSSEWEYFAGIDWGFTNPTAIIFVGIDIDGTYYVLNEYYQSGKTATELCQWFKYHILQYPKPIKFIYCDPAGRDEIATWCLLGIRNIAGMKTEVSDGIRRVTELIRANNMKVFNHCSNFIGEMEEYHIQSVSDTKDPSEDPVKKRDHCVDAFRYLVINTSFQYNKGLIGRDTTAGTPEERMQLQKNHYDKFYKVRIAKLPSKPQHL